MTMTFLASIIFVATSCVTSNKLENIFNDEYVVTRVDGLIESNDVSSIISNTVTKQYVEGLGISGGGDVASVNGKTGTVVIAASDVHARPDDWMPTAADTGALPLAGGTMSGDITLGSSGTSIESSGWVSAITQFGSPDGIMSLQFKKLFGWDQAGHKRWSMYFFDDNGNSHESPLATLEDIPVVPVTSVNSKTGDVNLTAADVGAVAVLANGCVAIGFRTTASGYYSHAEGVKANANENYSFSWNGDEAITYDSHGTGTFNLNPLGGLSGLWIGGSNLETILGGYAKRTGETETVDFRNTRTMVKTQLAPVGEDAVNFDMLVRYAAASSIATTYAPTNALVSLNQSVQYVTADSNGSAVEILAPTNSMKDWVVYIYTTTNNAVLFPTGTVYAVDSTVTNALKPNVVTAIYLSSYPAVSNGLIVGRQEMNPIVIVR